MTICWRCAIALLVTTASCARTDAPASGNATPADAAMETISGKGIEGRMRFLADDALEGRGTATRGYEIAARYVASELEADGLAPAGTNGSYFQPVPLRSSLVDGPKSSLVLRHDGRDERLTFAEEWTATGDPGQRDATIEASVVFVGSGITAPDLGYDDYKGIDVKGRIVAWVPTSPPFESTLKAHYANGVTRRANAAAHGAVGAIRLSDPTSEKSYAFTKIARDNNAFVFNWLDPSGRPNDYFDGFHSGVVVNLDVTRKLLAASGHSLEEIFAAAKAGKLQPFDMKVTARLHRVTNAKDVASPNVAARLEGSDPVLKNEYVVFTAHLDHLGLCAAVNGDGICNGALDNASGTAAMLELARAFGTMQPRPRRSLLFVAVTGEEAGLLGSDYFAHFPTVPKGAMVANINLDEATVLWPMKDIIAYGAEHSTLGALAQQAATRFGLTLSPDPHPDEVIFVRSDQYSFVKQGVPSVFPVVGFKSTDAKVDPTAIFDRWEAERYHLPQDDMQTPGVRFDDAATFTKFNFLLGYLVAQADARPAWNPGDFFGKLYAK